MKLYCPPTRAVPVAQREGQPQMVRWGGFIKHERAKAQLHARPVLIEIICWSMDSYRFDWKFAKPNEFLQGCLVRTFDTNDHMVYGVTFGMKPRILTVEGKERRQNLLQLPR